MLESVIEGAATPLAIAGIIFGVYVAGSWRTWIRGDHTIEPRRDGRIPAREMELLGDDWRDRVRRPVR